MANNNRRGIENLYDLVTGDEDARVCKDIPESACNDQPHNFFAYLISNVIGKIADELASAKLVLPWLLASVAAPAVFTGFLVPIREAGVLIPQLIVAAAIRHLPKRKGVWLLGAGLSSLALLAMAFAAASFEGVTAGWSIIGALVVFSLARGLCSVSAKDVLGKTVSKGRRGVLMGYSASLAGLVTLALGFYIQWMDKDSAGISLFVVLLVIGAVLWVLALLVFATIKELDGATEGGGNAISTALSSFSLLKTDADFRLYVITRILLLSVALAPPFYVLLAQQKTEGNIGGLGLLIVASGIANSLSAPIWGKLCDRSSRWVMAIASLLAAVLGIVVFLMVHIDAEVLQYAITHAIFFLALTIFHCGVRLGRKVFLVDLATIDNRATYVALSNTIIGIAMLAGGAIGILADIFDIHYVVLVLSVIAFVAAGLSLKLPKVSA